MNGEELSKESPHQDKDAQSAGPDADADMKACPMCGEMIKAAAISCRYCGEDFTSTAAPDSAPPPERIQEPPNALLAVWTRPRKTIRWLVANRPGQHVIMLAMLAFISKYFDNLASAYPNTPVLRVTQFSLGVLVSALIGVVVLFVMGFLLSLIGKAFGGKGDARALRTGYAWSWVPGICTLPLSGIMLIVFWTDSRLLEFQLFHSFLLHHLISVLTLVLAVWQIVLLVAGVSAAHQFSIVRAVGTILLSAALLGVALVAIVLPSTYIKVKYFPRATTQAEVAVARQEVQHRIERYLAGDRNALPLMRIAPKAAEDIQIVEATPGVRGNVELTLNVNGDTRLLTLMRVGQKWLILPSMSRQLSELDVRRGLDGRIRRYLEGDTDALPLIYRNQNITHMSVEAVERKGKTGFNATVRVRTIQGTSEQAMDHSVTLEIMVSLYGELIIMPIILP